jgi:hypothetical protein
MNGVIANVVKKAELLEKTLDSSRSASADLVGLNFKVPLQFRLQFKVYATKGNMTMTELLLQLFESQTGYAADGPKIAGQYNNQEM